MRERNHGTHMAARGAILIIQQYNNNNQVIHSLYCWLQTALMHRIILKLLFYDVLCQCQRDVANLNDDIIQIIVHSAFTLINLFIKCALWQI